MGMSLNAPPPDGSAVLAPHFREPYDDHLHDATPDEEATSFALGHLRTWKWRFISISLYNHLPRAIFKQTSPQGPPGRLNPVRHQEVKGSAPSASWTNSETACPAKQPNNPHMGQPPTIIWVNWPPSKFFAPCDRDYQ